MRGFENASLSQNTSTYPKRISSTMSPISGLNPSVGTFSNCTLNGLSSLLDTIPTISVSLDLTVASSQEPDQEEVIRLSN